LNARRQFSRNLTAVQRPDLAEKVKRGEINPAQASYIARHSVLAKLPEDFCDSFADLARVPKAPLKHRQKFQHELFIIIHDAWEKQENLDAFVSLTTDRAFHTAIKHLKAAKQALAQLNEVDRELLFLPIAEIEQGIEMFFESLGADLPKATPRRRGRPTGVVKHEPFRNFVWELLEITCAAGGNLSLEKNIGRGTLIDAINRLEEYLPSNFVPTRLAAPTLQRIKTSFRKHQEKRKAPK
jgi:hypothetical protein